MENLSYLVNDQLPAIGIGAAAAIATTAGLAYYMKHRLPPIRTVVPVEEQSMPVGEDSSCRISKLIPDGKFVEYIYEDCRTLYETFQRGKKRSNNGPCLGHRENGKGEYVWSSYSETIKNAEYLGSALILKGLQPETKTCVGIFAKNRPEWIITELACYTYSMVIVPIYETLGTEACAHIILQTQTSSVICDRNEQATLLIKLAARTGVLKRVIIIEQASEDVHILGHQEGVEVLQFETMLQIGKKNHVAPKPPKPADIATICYTSGTTGTPKGVVLTHRNVIAAVSATIAQLDPSIAPAVDHCLISLLPLGHMLTAMYMEGGRVGFYCGDIKRLGEDIKVLKPTSITVVPRLLNRIHDSVFGKVKGSWLKQGMLNLGLWFKEWDLRNRVINRNTIWDRLIFKKIQDEMGGRIMFVLVGSAPLSPNVLKFTRAALGCTVLEGYGQTETVAPVSVTIHGDISPEDVEVNTSHCGPPIPCCMVKLCDVPEMDIEVERDRVGEICVKGANVFSGYFKEPEKTREVLDEDGWLHTGDVGLWTENGCLRIIDRKKHIFKLSQGEYIAPEKIESIYVKNTYIAQVFVHGDSLKSCLIGIVVPEEGVLMRWAADEGVDGNFSSVCKNPKTKEFLLKELFAEGKAAGLHSFEQVKDIYIHQELFSVENNLLTPTLKTKRHDVKKTFAKQLSSMYSKLD